MRLAELLVSSSVDLCTYCGHDWLSVLSLDVTERHLCALVRTELELGEIEVRDLCEGDYSDQHLSSGSME